MKFHRDTEEHGDPYTYLWFDNDGNIFAHIVNDWGQLIGKWNWITFHFIHIYFERDHMVEGWEFYFVVLGFGFRFRWNLPAGVAKMKEWEDEIKVTLGEDNGLRKEN